MADTFICRLDGQTFATAIELQQHRASAHAGVTFPDEDDRQRTP
jgi:hypothetical protein